MARWLALGVALALLAACASEGTRGEADARSSRAAREPEPEAQDVPERVARSYEQALAAMSAGDWTEAELALEQFLLEHGEYPGAHVNLAIVYEHDGRLAEAEQALDAALELDPDFAAALNRRGMLLREQGDFEAAEAAYRRALDSDPGYTIARYNLAILLDVYLRRPAEALEEYRAYQQSLPTPDETVALWIVDLERQLRAAGEFPERDAQRS